MSDEDDGDDGEEEKEEVANRNSNNNGNNNNDNDNEDNEEAKYRETVDDDDDDNNVMHYNIRKRNLNNNNQQRSIHILSGAGHITHHNLSAALHLQWKAKDFMHVTYQLQCQHDDEDGGSGSGCDNWRTVCDLQENQSVIELVSTASQIHFWPEMAKKDFVKKYKKMIRF